MITQDNQNLNKTTIGYVDVEILRYEYHPEYELNIVARLTKGRRNADSVFRLIWVYARGWSCRPGLGAEAFADEYLIDHYVMNDICLFMCKRADDFIFRKLCQ